MRKRDLLGVGIVVGIGIFALAVATREPAAVRDSHVRVVPDSRNSSPPIATSRTLPPPQTTGPQAIAAILQRSGAGLVDADSLTVEDIGLRYALVTCRDASGASPWIVDMVGNTAIQAGSPGANLTQVSGDTWFVIESRRVTAYSSRDGMLGEVAGSALGAGETYSSTNGSLSTPLYTSNPDGSIDIEVYATGSIGMVEPGRSIPAPIRRAHFMSR